MTMQTLNQPLPAARSRAAEGALETLEAMARELASPWTRAYDAWRGGVEDIMARTARRPARPATRRREDSGCGCGCGGACACKDTGCEPDPCHCRCCVADSDLVIEARQGEQRMVPIVIENRWRRERPVEVQLSDWSCGADRLAIEARILEAASFTLPPCGEQALTLALRIGGGGEPNATKGAPPVPLESCGVCYADLRIKGCDLRAIRIAVAVLPADCGAYRVDCCRACC